MSVRESSPSDSDPACRCCGGVPRPAPAPALELVRRRFAEGGLRGGVLPPYSHVCGGDGGDGGRGGGGGGILLAHPLDTWARTASRERPTPYGDGGR